MEEAAMTALPNPFLNSTAIPEPPAVASTADSACRLQNVARPDVTAEREPHPNSVSPSPDLISEHARSAVASSDLQPRATAEPISQSALASAMTADTAAAPDLTDPPVPAAVTISVSDGVRQTAPSETEGAVSVSTASSDKFDEPTRNEGRPQETPASAPSKNPDVGVLADRIDWREFFDAVMDERFVLFELYDEVPLFIRDGEHLRRWTA